MSNRPIALLAAVLALAGAGPVGEAGRVTPDTCRLPRAAPVRIERVEGARTLLIADGRRLRLAGVDSFALLGVGMEEAETRFRTALSAIVTGREVRVRLAASRPDRHGRRVADAFLADGAPVAARLVETGFAVVRPEEKIGRCVWRLLAAEAAARMRGAGFWADVAPLRAAPPDPLSSHFDRYVLVEGIVQTVGVRRTRVFLNFGADWSRDTTVVIDRERADRFGGIAALRGLRGQLVRVRGVVRDRNGPLIAVEWPGQIEVGTGRQGGDPLDDRR